MTANRPDPAIATDFQDLAAGVHPVSGTEDDDDDRDDERPDENEAGIGSGDERTEMPEEFAVDNEDEGVTADDDDDDDYDEDDEADSTDDTDDADDADSDPAAPPGLD